MPRSVTIASTTWVKPPLTTASSYPSRLSVRTSVRAPGASGTALAHRVEVGLLQPGQQPHPPAQRVGEVDLARHGGRGDGGHVGAAAPALGQQVDDLPLQQGRVRVHHDQVLGPPVQARRLHRDVHLSPHRLAGQVAPQRPEIRPRDDELVGVHGIGGEPEDPLDVSAAACDAPVTPSKVAASIWGARTVTRCRSSSPVVSASVSGSIATSTPVPARCPVTASRTARTRSGATSASTESNRRPCTRTCSTSSTSTPHPPSAANRRSAMPGPSWPLTVTRWGDCTARAVTASRGRRRRPSPPPRSTGARRAPGRRRPRTGRGRRRARRPRPRPRRARRCAHPGG